MVIIVNKRKNLSNNRRMFFVISFLQIVIAVLPLVIVLAANSTGEWRGEWHGMTFAVSIFNFLLYSRASGLFTIFLLFTLFNPTYSRSSIVVLASLLISYIFSTALYGPRYAAALKIIRLISAQLWVLVSVLLLGMLLIFIGRSYIGNIAKQGERVSE